VGKKIPKSAHFPWDFVTLPEEDRATAIGMMHQKFGIIIISSFIITPKGST